MINTLGILMRTAGIESEAKLLIQLAKKRLRRRPFYSLWLSLSVDHAFTSSTSYHSTSPLSSPKNSTTSSLEREVRCRLSHRCGLYRPHDILPCTFSCFLVRYSSIASSLTGTTAPPFALTIYSTDLSNMSATILSIMPLCLPPPSGDVSATVNHTFCLSLNFVPILS